MKRIIFYCLLFLNPFIGGEAASPVDSLKSLLLKSADTSKLKILYQLIDLTSDIDSSLSLKYIIQAEKIANSCNIPLYKAKCLQLKGHFYKKRGDFSIAIDFYNQVADIFKEIKDLRLLAGVYNNLGATYTDKGEYQKAAEYLNKALRYIDQFNDSATKAKILLNIGLVFYYQKNYDKALDYYNQSLQIRKKLNDKKSLSLVYNNLGIVNYYKNNTAKAIDYFKKSLKLNQETDNIRGMSMPLFNIAELYFFRNNYDSALLYYQKSYIIDTTLKDKANIAKSLEKQAEINLVFHNRKIALKIAKEALKLSVNIDSKEDIKDCYKLLSNIYSEDHDLLNALYYSNLCNDIKDIIYSRQSAEMIADLQTKYETEKKDILLAKKDETIKHQIVISQIHFWGIVLALIFVTVIYWYYFQKKKAYAVLEFQKKNITDSINYACRIQTALLPPQDLINKLLPEHFILFLPRDIVSGDFYWITISNEKTIIAVADCTGHGVPGAFMSMLGFAYLNEIVNKSPDIKANEILNELRSKVKNSLHQNNDNQNWDGMDIALAIIDPHTKILQYSGANNPIAICHNSNISYLQPDKMPIGIYSNDSKPFSLREINLESNDIVYMFSDGYMDQFGGEKMKKLGKSNFDKLLIEASEMTIKAQRFFLEEKILEWMIDSDQIDDILVMGVKII